MDLQKIELTRINVSELNIERRTDYVAEDLPLHIFLNNLHYGTILCSPSQLKAMVLGHLLCEGVLKSKQEIDDLSFKDNGRCMIKLRPEIDAEKRISMAQRFSRIIISACGSPSYRPLSEVIGTLPKLDITPIIKANVVSQSVLQLNTIAEKFRQTGGVHAAALYSRDGELKAVAEDVGRHNAVDKIVGLGTAKDLDFGNHFLALSGRLSGDLVVKAARMKIPLIGSLSAAIGSGIEVAKLTGVTLVGFVRGKRMNVYTFPERIVLNSDQ